MTEESERALAHRTRLLASLLKIEGFQMLDDTLKKKEQRMGDALWQLLISPEGISDPQRALDHARGFIEGMRYAVAVPHGAERKLRGIDAEDEEEEYEMTDRWATWAR